MGGHTEGLASHAHQVGFGLRTRLGFAAGHHDVGPGRRQSLGDGPPDARVPPVTMATRPVRSNKWLSFARSIGAHCIGRPVPDR